MLYAAILALAVLNVPDVAPQILKSFATEEACLIDALKLNQTSEELRTVKARQAGAEFVCLRVVRAYI